MFLTAPLRGGFLLIDESDDRTYNIFIAFERKYLSEAKT
jgi:hypothetical protein